MLYFADVAQKKTLKRKREEYHVKEETPQTNTSTNVDMRHVNYRSNMTGLVKLMKSTNTSTAWLPATNTILEFVRCIEKQSDRP
ncbi:hypothetical protein CsSME_00032176 [Camellia sinensis var. sinensis]